MKSAVGRFPSVGYGHEALISVLSDEPERVPVLPVLVPFSGVPRLDQHARHVLRTIGTRLKPPFLEAAYLYLALGLVDVPFTSLIPQLAATGYAFLTRSTGPAIRATTANLSYRHLTNYAGSIGHRQISAFIAIRHVC